MTKKIFAAAIVLSLVFVLGCSEISGLPADLTGTSTKTFTRTAQAGSHTLKVIADSNNEVTESNETNNVKTYMFSTLAPDLILESITWSPAYPTIGDTVTFTVTIKNQGSSKASYSYVAYYIERPRRWVIQVAYLTSASVSPIEPGATVAKTFLWKAEVGLYIFKAIIDEEDQILESDESNNEKSTVPLSILSVFLPPAPTLELAPSPVPLAPAPTLTPPAPPAPAPSVLNWPLIGGIIAVTVILALLIFLLVRRRVTCP